MRLSQPSRSDGTGGQMSWRKQSKKVMLMIGDSLPHDTSYASNSKSLKWEDELEKLKSMVTI